MVLDRAAHMRDLDELDEPHALQRAHVVGDGAQRSVEPAGQLHGAGGALVEHREDADAQRMAHRLHVAGIVDVLDRFHASTNVLRNWSLRR